MQLVVSYTNHKIGNADVREDMDQVDIPYPTPEDFEQEEVFTTGFDYISDRYLSLTWISATPEDIEETSDPEELDRFLPRPNIVFRLKPEVTRANGLKAKWMICSDARDVTLPDGTVLKFPKGSKVIQSDYDEETAVPEYERPQESF